MADDEILSAAEILASDLFTRNLSAWIAVQNFRWLGQLGLPHATRQATEQLHQGFQSASSRVKDAQETRILENLIKAATKLFTALDAFLSNCGKAPASGLASLPIRSVAQRAAAVLKTAKGLSEAVSRVGAIAARRGLPFDLTPDSVARFADPDSLPGLTKETPVDAAALAEARRLVTFPLVDKPVAEIRRLKSFLEKEVGACSDSLDRCRQATERLGIPFDSTERAVEETAALAKIAAAAPGDLLEYRRATFGYARDSELIEKCRSALTAERNDKASFETVYGAQPTRCIR